MPYISKVKSHQRALSMAHQRCLQCSRRATGRRPGNITRTVHVQQYLCPICNRFRPILRAELALELSRYLGGHLGVAKRPSVVGSTVEQELYLKIGDGSVDNRSLRFKGLKRSERPAKRAQHYGVRWHDAAGHLKLSRRQESLKPQAAFPRPDQNCRPSEPA